jgi:hypothetical protein
MLMSCFLKEHSKAQAVLCTHDWYWEALKEAISQGFNPKYIISIFGQTPPEQKTLAGIPFINVPRPSQAIGHAIAVEFEKRWLGLNNNEKIDLSIKFDFPENNP